MSEALMPRSSSGFRLICMRPVFTVAFVPSIPIKDERLSTLGSRRITRASACCRSAMAAKDMVCRDSEIPRIMPVSCTGKNPLGITIYSHNVATSVPTVTNNVNVWWRITQRSVVA